MLYYEINGHLQQHARILPLQRRRTRVYLQGVDKAKTSYALVFGAAELIYRPDSVYIYYNSGERYKIQ